MTKPKKRPRGRPPLTTGRMTKRLVVECTPEDHERFRLLAKRFGMGIGALIRCVLNEYDERLYISDSISDRLFRAAEKSGKAIWPDKPLED